MTLQTICIKSAYGYKLRSMVFAIDIKDLSVRLRGDFIALESVSLKVKDGSIIGLIGPSGAGKTTLIRSIVGRQKIASGQVQVLGQPAGSPALRNKLRYMTQSRSIYNDLTVFQNLDYFATMFDIVKPQRVKQIKQVLDLLDIASYRDRLVSSLSGGQQQRVSLAVCLLGDASLLVLDEPTVGLDPVLREQIWSLLRSQAKAGKTIIISSHVMDEAERVDQLVLLRDGKVIAHDTPAGFCRKTDSQSVEAGFIKAIQGVEAR